jgi:GNAT superfamily N-acetyltransferase
MRTSHFRDGTSYRPFARSRRGRLVPVKRALGNGYELDDDRARLDHEAIHAYIGGVSYWAKGRTRERQDELIDASARVVGLYMGGEQVGFARAVDCDAAGFVYLADVYVLDEHRGRGLGVELVREIVENGPLAERTWVLHTRDAHALYEKLGFGPHPRLMQRGANPPR